LDANNAAPLPSLASPHPRSRGYGSQFVTMIACAVVVVVFGILLGRTKDPVFEIVTWSKVILGLGLVIFIHELGHFLAAKWCDVHVQTFSIGFGPPLFGICAYKWGETNYKLAWLPLGGYVKMVGEGDESEEGEDDPRSFKNKRVWQRMIIISAGVIMNVILGSAFFIGVYITHGIKHVPGVISSVDPGGPAWVKGLRSGAEIQQIGWRKNPDYLKIISTIMNSREGRQLPFVFRTFPDGLVHETEIEPIKTADSGKPVIGIRVNPPSKPELLQPHRDFKGPYHEETPAAKLGEAIQFGDRIVASSDPDDPSKMKPLPPDPRNPGENRLDYFALKRRFQQLGGQPVRLELLRGPNNEQVQVTLEPTFHNTLGLRLRVDEVSAVREGSPAARAGVRVNSDKGPGDVIVAVEVTDAAGKKRKFTSHKDLGAGEMPLDPARLPYDLMQWAASKPGSKQVQLTVLRPVDHEARKETVLKIDWDDDWTWEESDPFTPGSSMAINGLGLAFKIQTTIDSVEPGTPAAAANLRDGDVITEFQVRYGTGEGESTKDGKTVRADQGAFITYIMQGKSIEEITLTIGNDRKAVLKPQLDKSWPMTDRGLVFEPDVEFQKADGLGNALVMGLKKTLDTIEMIYQSLRSLATFRVSITQVYGPVGIAKTSYEIAGENIFDFLVFLALININLAVVNFLPIPVLDGGHMVFLLYEWLRGKPPSDRVRFIASIIGLIFILGLMALAFGVDLNRYVFKY
jgi:regulator of sigma E protease